MGGMYRRRGDYGRGRNQSMGPWATRSLPTSRRLRSRSRTRHKSWWLQVRVWPATRLTFTRSIWSDRGLQATKVCQWICSLSGAHGNSIFSGVATNWGSSRVVLWCRTFLWCNGDQVQLAVAVWWEQTQAGRARAQKHHVHSCKKLKKLTNTRYLPKNFQRVLLT